MKIYLEMKIWPFLSLLATWLLFRVDIYKETETTQTMAIVITDLLGTDSFSGSRLTINANFQSLKSEVEALETNLGVSVASGNIDVSGATGGQIKGKLGAFNDIQLPAAGSPTITLAGTTGNVVLTIGTLTAPTINVGAINITGNVNQTAGSTVLEQTTFNGLITITDGESRSKIDVGLTATHTVLNSDGIILFDGSGGTMTLTADVSLVDGHISKLVKYGSGSCSLNTAAIQSATTITFQSNPYVSSIDLMWVVALNKWIIIGSSNMAAIS